MFDDFRVSLAQSLAKRPGHSDHDVWGMYRTPPGLRRVAEMLAMPMAELNIQCVLGLEARGFVLGGAVATIMDLPFVPVRKVPAYLTGKTLQVETEPDWIGKRVQLAMQSDALAPGARALLVDDWLTTCSQMSGAKRLVESCGGQLVAVAVVVEEVSHERARLLGPTLLHSLLKWSEEDCQFTFSKYDLTAPAHLAGR